jgi:Fe-S oxidoreductase
MQCMACVEICPVGIEHVPIINQMRRALVEKGDMDGQLQQTLETIYTSGNSFGEAKRKRGRWAKDLDFDGQGHPQEPGGGALVRGRLRLLRPAKPEGEPIARRILRRAGVDFGIPLRRRAHRRERRAPSWRRGPLRDLAEENVATISGCSFDRILTSDPHSFNTLKNEYPQSAASGT